MYAPAPTVSNNDCNERLETNKKLKLYCKLSTGRAFLSSVCDIIQTCTNMCSSKSEYVFNHKNFADRLHCVAVVKTSCLKYRKGLFSCVALKGLKRAYFGNLTAVPKNR